MILEQVGTRGMWSFFGSRFGAKTPGTVDIDALVFGGADVAQTSIKDEIGEAAKESFQKFIENFVLDEAESEREDEEAPSEGEKVPHYIQKIKEMMLNDTTTLYCDFQHIVNHDQILAEAIELHFYRLDPYLRKAVQNVVHKEANNNTNYIRTDEKGNDKEYWISFYNHTAIYKVRDLKTNKIGRLCSIRATVTRTSEVRPELLYGTFQCLDCRAQAARIEQQFRYTEPIACKNPTCGNNSRWQLVIESSKFVDWQKVRVQENSDEIPSGSMPRTLDIILRHEEVDKAKAGDKCLFTGTLIVVPDISRGRAPGPKIEGNIKNNLRKKNDVEGSKDLDLVKDYNYRLCFLACAVQPSNSRFGVTAEEAEDEEFTEEELEDIEKMRATPKIYEHLIHSIAPAVYGHHDVKKGILLMLFGGVHKVTEEGINLRGDINVCIVGDPSTAKSQFLKYIVSFLPRAVYTSGKASSAAGLTATVVKDPDTGEFNIEAGALMLADNGICCIDEFDKMDPKDQVAIHEAMEQQTISIAKAGIHATLNARTSILAAANPIGGRYDKSKTLKSNLNVTPAIMSRFDLFFVVLDECDEATDVKIARHIVGIHQRQDQALKPAFTTKQLQNYIKFSRRLKPIITPEAEKLLVENYRKLRQSDVIGHGKTAYRITVRQLESMIRLSEALARLNCSDKVLPEYVQEAATLLRKSIIHVETGDVIIEALPQPSLSTPSTSTTTSNPKKSKKTNKRRAEEDEEEEEPAEPKKGAKQKDASPQKKEQMQVTFEKYQQIVKMLVIYMHPLHGVRQGDLIQWYISQVEEDIHSEDALLAETRLVTRIIQRLITKDHILIVVTEAQNGDLDQRILDVNPNYEV